MTTLDTLGAAQGREVKWMLQPGRILVPQQLIAGHSLPRGYRPSPRLRRLTQGRAFFFAFPRRFAFSLARFAFPGETSVLALRFSWRFFFPGGSRFLAIPVSWRFPSPGDSQHVLAGRGLVVILQLQLTVGSWLSKLSHYFVQTNWGANAHLSATRLPPK